LITYAAGNDDKAIMAKVERETIKVPTEMMMDLNVIIQGIGMVPESKQTEPDLRMEQEKLT